MNFTATQLRGILSRYYSSHSSQKLSRNVISRHMQYFTLSSLLSSNCQLPHRRYKYTFHPSSGLGQKWKSAVVHGLKIAGNIPLNKILLDKLKPDINVIMSKALACQESRSSVYQYFGNIDLLLREDSATSWPGVTTTLLCQSIVSLLPDHLRYPAVLEDSKSKQKAVADFLNLLHIFYMVTLERYRKSVCWSGEGYFSWHDEWITSYIYLSKYLVMTAEKACSQLRNDKAMIVLHYSMKTIGEMKYGIHFSRLPSGKRDLVSDLTEWKERTTQRVGDFLYSGFQTALDISGHSQECQERFGEFGKCLALAVQAHSDLQEFINYDPTNNSTFDLCILPVALYSQNHPELVNALQNNRHTLDERDYSTLHLAVTKNSAVEEACTLIKQYAEESLKFLDNLEPSDAKDALRKMIISLIPSS